MRRIKNILIVTDPRAGRPWAAENGQKLKASLALRGWKEREILEFLAETDEIFNARKIARPNDAQHVYACENGRQYVVYSSGLCVQIMES